MNAEIEDETNQQDRRFLVSVIRIFRKMKKSKSAQAND